MIDLIRSIVYLLIVSAALRVARGLVAVLDWLAELERWTE